MQKDGRYIPSPHANLPTHMEAHTPHQPGLASHQRNTSLQHQHKTRSTASPSAPSLSPLPPFPLRLRQHQAPDLPYRTSPWWALWPPSSLALRSPQPLLPLSAPVSSAAASAAPPRKRSRHLAQMAERALLAPRCAAPSHRKRFTM